MPISPITRNPENVLIGHVHVFDNFTCVRGYVRIYKCVCKLSQSQLFKDMYMSFKARHN